MSFFDIRRTFAPADAESGGAPDDAGRQRVLAYVTDEESEKAIRSGMPHVGDALLIRRGTAQSAAKSLSRELSPHVVLVDVTGLDDAVHALQELLEVCQPDTRLLVVGDRADIGFYRDITTRIGATEYLYKPLTRETVARVFGPVISGVKAAPNVSGKVTAVCGVQPGVGTTTIAVNLALQLSEASKGHVALLDLSLRNGAAALMLGVRTRPGLREALEDPQRIDAEFVNRVGVWISERMCLVAAEEPMDAEINPTEDGVAGVLETLRQRFNYVVVDMRLPVGIAERAVLSRARHSILVMRPDVASIRGLVLARKLVAAAAPDAKTLTVINSAGRPGFLSERQVRDGIGETATTTIRYLPDVLPGAANSGRPALHGSRELRRDLAILTQEISSMRLAIEPQSFLGRLFGRGAA
jgi:pilus assembly protein CpaE